jgi:hypothetical protein
MKLQFNSRKWHAWISFAISLPILIVAITAIFIAHGQKLGFRDIKVDASWLPGYSGASAQREVRAASNFENGLWVGTQSGLFVRTDAGIGEIKSFSGQEIRTLLHTNHNLFVLTTQGLFARRGEQWSRVSRGPVISAYADGDNVYMMTRDKGLQFSGDGGATWGPSAQAQSALALLSPLGAEPAKIMLARVIRDLHTGEAILGHDREWIWNDIVGGTMTFLGITGLYLWWRGQRRMAFRRRAG